MFGQALQDLSGLAADTYTLTGAGAVSDGDDTDPVSRFPQAGQPITRHTFGRHCHSPPISPEAFAARAGRRRQRKYMMSRGTGQTSRRSASRREKAKRALPAQRRISSQASADNHTARNRHKPGADFGLSRRQRLVRLRHKPNGDQHMGDFRQNGRSSKPSNAAQSLGFKFVTQSY